MRVAVGLLFLLVALPLAVTIIGGVAATDWNVVAEGGWWWLLLVLGWPIGLFAWGVWKDDGGDPWR